ncbi:hypothetical protein OIU34_18110 [Pararhizobium sp. BT-229]|uniref:hypothetical protein n=1 Tax=Pararhizobium sp. BT-229 TaxID=2986923 RepID=UPI0021F6D605|nr:hypothetical protein [Pararhizobium sp. BT-229]MCV9963794.1 hypothetical protein [Pararhizobium sp. BT-229]
MMHILYAVIAIALTCLVTFGGVNYMRADAPVRVVASRGLSGQYEALLLGISAYRNVNNGITPKDVASFSGFLPNGSVPSFGTASEGFEWTVEKPEGETGPVLCLKVDATLDVRFEAAAMFAREALRRGGGRISVAIGNACGEGQPFTDGSAPPGNGTAFLTIRGF